MVCLMLSFGVVFDVYWWRRMSISDSVRTYVSACEGDFAFYGWRGIGFSALAVVVGFALRASRRVLAGFGVHIFVLWGRRVASG
jgi:hypothetical protein